MATLAQKVEAEQKMRRLLEESGMPMPDVVEYGHTCIRLIYHEEKLCVVVDIDKPPPGWEYIGERLDEGWGDVEDHDEEEEPM